MACMNMRIALSRPEQEQINFDFCKSQSWHSAENVVIVAVHAAAAALLTCAVFFDPASLCERPWLCIVPA